jgi:hypothetical protein
MFEYTIPNNMKDLPEEEQQRILKNIIVNKLATDVEEDFDDTYNEDSTDDPRDTSEPTTEEEEEPEPEEPLSRDERYHAFGLYVARVFGDIPKAQRTREQYCNLYFAAVTNPEFADLTPDEKMGCLEVVRQKLNIAHNLFPAAVKVPETDVQAMMQWENEVAKKHSDKQRLLNREVLEVLSLVEEDLCEPTFLEEAIRFQQNVVQWNYLLKRIREDWNIEPKEFLTILEDYNVPRKLDR